MYGPRPAARLCNEKMALVWSRTALAMFPSRWADPGRGGLSPTCLNTGCEACAYARGCEQLLLSSPGSIFLFCCLALSLSVFLASKCERCWGRWRRWIWGLQTSLSGRARSAWHSPRERGFIVSRQLHVLRHNRRELMSLADQVAFEPARVFVHGQLRCSCNSWSWVEDLHCSAVIR